MLNAFLVHNKEVKMLPLMGGGATVHYFPVVPVGQ